MRGPSYGSKKPYARGSGTQEGPKNLVLRGIQKVNIQLGVSVSYLHELVRRERSEGFETLHVIEYGFVSLVIGRIKIEKLFESVPTCIAAANRHTPHPNPVPTKEGFVE